MKLLVMLGALWAAVALTVQVLRAHGGGRRDHSRRAGSPARGLLYNFTVAMTPAHKEAVSRHPVKFALGVLMHAGGAVSLLGVGLLVQRMFSPTLRAMSAPDDYLAIVASCGLLALVSIGPGHETALMLYTSLLLIYLPLGKLRHVVFFFVARADYGRRLGHRGVYPPAATGAE
jgi:hypothetical protein